MSETAAGTRAAGAKGARPRRLRRGAAILPSLFTVGNLFLGFWSMIKAIHGEFEPASHLLFWAIVLDMLDGRIARLTGTTSEFGGELDSLADVISFGVAPALLAYQWAFPPIPRAGWLAAFLFVAAGALRLARFNVQRHASDGRFFVGLPIPAAAGQVAALVAVLPGPLDERPAAFGALAVVVILAFLMVSTFRYRSFKGVDLRARRSYASILGIAVALVVLFIEPAGVLVTLATGYALSGPAAYLYGLLRRKSGGPPAVVAETTPLQGL
ncbi:MAG TPA: CDP-diacylglycerol--serine O-phosphatidyltransferase [Vicinamibacteria bacterium]|nr:CDP-diacylglycerol--serine O-phosphatidyltransferase [Vicinamibacteria bacterium]